MNENEIFTNQLCRNTLHNSDFKEDIVLNAIFFLEGNTVSKPQHSDFGLSGSLLYRPPLLSFVWATLIIEVII